MLILEQARADDGEQMLVAHRPRMLGRQELPPVLAQRDRLHQFGAVAQDDELLVGRRLIEKQVAAPGAKDGAAAVKVSSLVSRNVARTSRFAAVRRASFRAQCRFRAGSLTAPQEEARHRAK